MSEQGEEWQQQGADQNEHQQQEEARFKAEVIFTVFKHKTEGLLIKSIREANSQNEFYFRTKDQPIDRHCPFIQEAIKKANVKGTKGVLVDLTDCVSLYVNTVDGSFQYNAVKLKSTQDELIRQYQLRINKEIGQIKRKFTMEDKKNEEPPSVYNARLKAKYAAEEAMFQQERARRIDEVMRAREEQQRRRG